MIYNSMLYQSVNSHKIFMRFLKPCVTMAILVWCNMFKLALICICTSEHFWSCLGSHFYNIRCYTGLYLPTRHVYVLGLFAG